jgi:hypothetical protein
LRVIPQEIPPNPSTSEGKNESDLYSLIPNNFDLYAASSEEGVSSVRLKPLLISEIRNGKIVLNTLFDKMAKKSLDIAIELSTIVQRNLPSVPILVIDNDSALVS